jgi:ABC-type glycerol-3-phosphate transport system permease component
MSELKKVNKEDKIFDVLLYVFMVFFALSTIYPFLYLLTTSLLSADVPLTKIYIVPPKISLNNYFKVVTDEYILYGFKNMIYYLHCLILHKYPFRILFREKALKMLSRGMTIMERNMS